VFTLSISEVIDAYAKSSSSDAASNAERIFRMMEADYETGNEDARPNAHSFNTVINAWAKSNAPGSASRAEEVLEKMIVLYDEDARHDTRPNCISFTTVINGWAKSGESGAALRAERVFTMMEDEYKKGNTQARPNAFSYSSLIDAWVKSGEEGSIQRADDIFHKLHSDFIGGSTKVKPSTPKATQIIDAWSRSGQNCSGEKSERLLSLLSDLYKRYGDDEMRPNARSYTCAINAWAKCRKFGKAKHAYNILLDMIAAYENGNTAAKPNVFSFTSVVSKLVGTNQILLPYFFSYLL
jgi:hypothetical protein